MQKQYFVSHQDEQLGPFSVDEIVAKINRHEFGVSDYIYDDTKSDWVLIMEHPHIMQGLDTKKPKAPPRAPTLSTDTVPQVKTHKNTPPHMTYEWFVLKGESSFGPFAYSDLVKMLQEKNLFEFDYVWHAQLPTWIRLAELTEFHPHEIAKLKTNAVPEVSEMFFRRRHKRSSFNASIVVHDNRAVWKGEAIEISAGGAGLFMDNAMLVPGQTLFLHFKPGDGIPSFNATCEIVSKKFLPAVRDRQTTVKYGVKFVQIEPTAQDSILVYTNREQTAS